MPPSPSELAANRLMLAFKDMHDVVRYLKAYSELTVQQDQENTSRYFDHCEGILVAAVVAYCRPFKRSSSIDRADPKLDPRSLACLTDRSELGALHALLEERRDKAIAHGDWEYHSTELPRRPADSGVLRRSPVAALVQGIDPTLFEELAQSVANECACRAFDLDRQTLRKEAP